MLRVGPEALERQPECRSSNDGRQPQGRVGSHGEKREEVLASQGAKPLISRRVRCAFSTHQIAGGTSKGATHPTNLRPFPEFGWIVGKALAWFSSRSTKIGS